MVINGIVIGFENPSNESLKDLIISEGYSKPTKADPVARARIVFMGQEIGNVEVERKEDRVFATLSNVRVEHILEAVDKVLSDFQNINLLPGYEPGDFGGPR